jgi:predicted TIM-barrel fold metal-dependent hydrolase
MHKAQGTQVYGEQGGNQMLDRRQFMALGGGTMLAACGQTMPILPFQPDYPVIDIHGHIFNGKDIPAAGFLDQVVLRDPHEAVTDPGIVTALARLGVFILRQTTLGPREELRQLTRSPGAAAEALAPSAPDAPDQAAVARALAEYRAAVASRSEASSLDGSPPADTRLINELYPTGAGEQALAIGEDPDTAAASRIYEKSTGRTYVRQSPLFQTIRWAGLLTRPRSEILAEYLRLYVTDGPVRLVSPSVLDFELWFRENEPVAALSDQVEVMSEIARRTEPLLVLNFLQFCPLRAAQSPAQQYRSFELLEHAIEDRGFAGIKLYPALGYRPIGNDPGALYGGKPGQRVSGARIDAELTALYTWCEDKGVPIKAHCTNSNDAGQCTAAFGSPNYWRQVLARWPGLSLNLAHFGSFHESREMKACDGGDTDWEELIAKATAEAPGLYADMGYWTDAYLGPRADRQYVKNGVRRLLAAHPELGERLMFGTDWSMLAREPTHPNYIGQVQRSLRQTGLSRRKVMYSNALRYLGLDRDSQQALRLSRFFGADRLSVIRAEA